MIMRLPTIVIIATCCLGFSATAGAAPLPPTNLRCEYLRNPMGIDVLKPRFSWELQHTARGQAQTAYQIIVYPLNYTPTPQAMAPFWDSGRVASPQSSLVEYAGPPLLSGHSYTWQVHYWDKDGQRSPDSDHATFEMGLLSASEWKGQWIGGNNLMRRDFTVPSAVLRARVYVAAAGYYGLFVNGGQVGADRYLDPGYTAYNKRVLYVTYDVTGWIHQGPNTLGLQLGEGRFSPRVGIVQLNIEMTDGKTMSVVSDDAWRMHASPVVSDSVYNGETYDARMVMNGWGNAEFDVSTWQPVKTVPFTTTLSAMMMPPVRVTQTLSPVKRTMPRPGVYVYDFGQNFSGWTRLRVRGPAGTQVRLRHAELLQSDGMLNTENLRAAQATDTYILRGPHRGQTTDDEVYEPHFTYHGYRYVEVTGYPGVPPAGAIMARVANTDVTAVGGFASSSQVLNDIQRITQWGILSNLHSIPTDCNQRDEREGWTADAHLAAESAIWNFDMAAFYTNFLRDMRDSQSDAGMIPDTVPPHRGGARSDPAWGSAYPLIVSYMYDYYGDRRVLEENYEGLKRWVGWLHSLSNDSIVEHYNYGDWVPVDPTPGALVSTAYYAYSTQIAARAAKILGHSADAQAFDAELANIKAAFQKRFWHPETRSYGNGSQTSLVLPLFLGLAPRETQGQAGSRLTDNIVYEKDTHLTTGILGTKYVLPLLTSRGRADLAYELATQSTYPSWGYMISHGATTLWELWQERTGPSMNSHNHPMFGSVAGWMYQALAGINFDPERPGFERVIVQPHMVDDLKWVSGSIQTQRGLVAVSWNRTPDRVEMEVTIPVGSEAEIHVPKPRQSGGKLKEPLAPGDGVVSVKEAKDEFVVAVGSGQYRLKVE
jgi:alpha-L-rhamnosidase